MVNKIKCLNQNCKNNSHACVDYMNGECQREIGMCPWQERHPTIHKGAIEAAMNKNHEEINS